jgi:hypothetical protein
MSYFKIYANIYCFVKHKMSEVRHFRLDAAELFAVPTPRQETPELHIVNDGDAPQKEHLIADVSEEIAAPIALDLALHDRQRGYPRFIIE